MLNILFDLSELTWWIHLLCWLPFSSSSLLNSLNQLPYDSYFGSLHSFYSYHQLRHSLCECSHVAFPLGLWSANCTSSKQHSVHSRHMHLLSSLLHVILDRSGDRLLVGTMSPFAKLSMRRFWYLCGWHAHVLRSLCLVSNIECPVSSELSVGQAVLPLTLLSEVLVQYSPIFLLSFQQCLFPGSRMFFCFSLVDLFFCCMMGNRIPHWPLTLGLQNKNITFLYLSLSSHQHLIFALRFFHLPFEFHSLCQGLVLIFVCSLVG